MPVRDVLDATRDIRRASLRLANIARSLRYSHGETDLVTDLDYLSGGLMQDAIDIEQSVQDDLSRNCETAREHVGLLLSAVCKGKIGNNVQT